MADKFAEIQVTVNKCNSNIEVVVPAGTSHRELGKLNLVDLLSKFRPSGCGACLSGGHLLIREKLEKVLPVDLNTGVIGH